MSASENKACFRYVTAGGVLMNLSDMVRKMQELGYETDDAEARVCQDIV